MPTDFAEEQKVDDGVVERYAPLTDLNDVQLCIITKKVRGGVGSDEDSSARSGQHGGLMFLDVYGDNVFEKLQSLVTDVMKASFAPGGSSRQSKAGGAPAISGNGGRDGGSGGSGDEDDDTFGMGLFDDMGGDSRGDGSADKKEKQLYWFDLKVVCLH